MARRKVVSRTWLRKVSIPNWVWRGSGLACLTILNRWMSTLNYRVRYLAPGCDPADFDFKGPVIFLFWHEYIPFPVYLRPNCRLAMLLSQHQDAEVLSQVAHFAGLETVRGSTNRGGTSALRELLQRGQGLSLAITPDGPRGPRRELAQGAIYLSSRLQIPLISIGFGLDRPWRNRRSWDQFAIPRPFSRARVVVGPQIQIAPDLDRDGIESERLRIQQHLNEVTTLAEDWAATKIDMPDSRILYRCSPSQPELHRSELVRWRATNGG